MAVIPKVELEMVYCYSCGRAMPELSSPEGLVTYRKHIGDDSLDEEFPKDLICCHNCERRGA
jgi:hypothetical protein